MKYSKSVTRVLSRIITSLAIFAWIFVCVAVAIESPVWAAIVLFIVPFSPFIASDIIDSVFEHNKK